jgi:hypothetical protein
MAMEHGIKNEINGLATLITKYVPVFYPELVYKEDGCEIIRLENCVAVVSGDGTLCLQQTPESLPHTIAVEIKCPVPGKIFTTDTYYSLPPYYATQVLSQMAAKQCSSYLNACYTHSSTSFIEGQFDLDLWLATEELVKEVCSPRKPTKKSQKSIDLKSQMKSYAAETQFIAEFPSVVGVECAAGKATSVSIYGMFMD